RGRDDRRGGWQHRDGDERRGRDDRGGGWQNRREGDRRRRDDRSGRSRGRFRDERPARRSRGRDDNVRPGFGQDRTPHWAHESTDEQERDIPATYDESQEGAESENVVNEERRSGDPVVPEGVSADMLDPQMRKHLLSLRKEVADFVACHLVMAGVLLDSDPQAAHQHALAAQRRAARVGIVREALALTSYKTGAWALALREIHAFRRLTGTKAHEVIAADCERGRGNPKRALELISEVNRDELTDDFRAELALVESGAYADLGESEAGLQAIQTELAREHSDEARARLLSVGADRLRELGDDARADAMAGESEHLCPPTNVDGESLDDDLLIVQDD
ncbi:MAG: hypothetical protein Q4Q03_08335, partial [Bowdeniella nasicola]|nr:hypothetical protein [Bowdeniella nasicola]